MMAKKTTAKADEAKKDASISCGLVMPISSIDGCSSDHWREVREIIEDSLKSISEFNFQTKMVSEADDVGVIQKRIVQNLYLSDMMVT